MKTKHEWERVICAASQGNKNGIDCSDTNEFGGPSMGFPHSNGREAADPFDGKDLNVFEYEKETGPSLGIKIDLIAEWIVTQARSCPTSCGNSARNFSGSVTCSTGDDADCDPNTKPAIPTRSCGKTADCPTYTGTWVRGSCSTTCGQSNRRETVSVSCSGGNCDPSAKPSTRRWCWATPPCVVNCQVSGWSSWTDIGDGSWGSCSKSCGGGTQTKDQERERTITTQPQNGGRACPHLRETQSVSRSCNTHSCACPAKPDHSSWDDAVNGGTQPNCDWSCNAGRIWKDGSCKTTGPYTFGNCPNHHGYSGGYIYGTCSDYDICTPPATKSCAPVCKGGSSWNGSSCECTGQKVWDSNLNLCIRVSCGGGSVWDNDSNSCVCSGGRSWNGSSCVCPAGKTWNSGLNKCESSVQRCPSLPSNARWLNANHGKEQPNCSWTCESGYEKNASGGCDELRLWECRGGGNWVDVGICGGSQGYYCMHSSIIHEIKDTCCMPLRPTASCAVSLHH